jgi:O-methyltransferase
MLARLVTRESEAPISMDLPSLVSRLAGLPSVRPCIRRLPGAPGLYRAARRRAPMRFPTFPDDAMRSVVSHPDYFRFAAVGLALSRLEAEGVPGALAEVGVYRGEMSRFIHRVTPGRTLYLFDTFAGFPAEDLEPGTSRADAARFQDTSVEEVLRGLHDQRNVVVRRGRVPVTFAGLEGERFSFALVDLDLYEPTLNALEFLYERMSPGGYLFVHDYNNRESNFACRRALDLFLEGVPERIVELPDLWGTAVVRKS